MPFKMRKNRTLRPASKSGVTLFKSVRILRGSRTYEQAVKHRDGFLASGVGSDGRKGGPPVRKTKIVKRPNGFFDVIIF